MRADPCVSRDSAIGGVPTYVVNAFCETGRDGNPAAVCIVSAGDPDEGWMQAVARQMNLSETCFLMRLDEGRYSIRWFSPISEVPLCGHATLAGAHVLWEQGLVEDASIAFIGKQQTLAASRRQDSIELDFPAIRCDDAPVPEWFVAAFGIPPVRFFSGPGKCLAEMPDEGTIRRLQPDFALLRRVADRGVIVTSLSPQGPCDVVSRYFAAYVGVDEDPVTGSAHCCLGPYWTQRLGRTSFTAEQASPRGGRLGVRVAGERVHLTGRAQTVLAGTLFLS